MNNIRKIHIPSICITFTLVILCSCIWNIIQGNPMTGYISFVFQLFGYLVIMRMIGIVINKIDFKKYIHYFFTEMITYYIVLFVFAFCGNWFGFRLENILWVTVCFWAIGGYMHYHFYQIQKADAEEINRKIIERGL